ncbi:hypothetical protein IDSA_01030 [Pseudidiomarina salinarum]|uniref:Lipoprotein n=1 Tax=Pseudidiomarina salinarum TaxID=435908 RepID=A0A094L979_9GAMM|nr:YjbF family lipoprotein [Pseudidiomarina salinarum]KFZ31343.1 hypothetical protein IDSA_01030 [Pseudidiomarina salinarum]RUO70899.1 hypothetical protein CWI79_05525 [Pseudidiomarina salinarum]
MTINFKPLLHRMGVVMLIGAILSVAGCSTRVKNLAEIAKFAVDEPDDVVLTAAEIKDYPHAAQYIEFDDQPQVLMALNFDDQGVLKWRTGGEEVVMTRRGRFIGSVNIANAPIQIQEHNPDPLLCMSKNMQRKEPVTSNCESVWQRTLWINNRTETTSRDTTCTLVSEFSHSGEETLLMPNDEQIAAQVITESGEVMPTVQGQEPIPFENTFWIDPGTGRTLKSRQFVSPTIGYVDITEVKAYAGDVRGSKE